jgi:hypothetical protein
VLIPLVGGIVVLLLPVRRKSEDEPEKALSRRRTLQRLAGLALIGVAGLYLLIKVSQPTP